MAFMSRGSLCRHNKRFHPLKITELITKEKKSIYTKEEIETLKFRRMRDLNNEACKRFRDASRCKQQELEQDLIWEEERNRNLKMLYEEEVRKIKVLKAYMYKIGLKMPKDV